MWLCELWKKAFNLTKIIFQDGRALKNRLICGWEEIKKYYSIQLAVSCIHPVGNFLFINRC